MGVHPLSRKLPAFVVALSLLAALPGVALAQTNRATLIDVHRVTISKAKPGPATANCANAPSNPASGGFAFTGWEVQGNKAATLNTSSIPAGLGTVSAIRTQLNNSFGAWKQAQSAAPSITVSGTTSITKATANHSYDVLFGRTSGSSIAVTYTWQWSNGEIESDTVFNTRLPWFIATSEGDGCAESTARYDLANIATHEFGHTYGLGHAANGRWETMYPYGFTGETLKRSLAAGDTAGIRSLY
jgi:matrixin